MTELLLPIGHALGPIRWERDEYLVRTGLVMRRVPGGLPYVVWTLAHGFPDIVRERAWTRAELTRAAAHERATIDPVVDQLIADGFLAEIPTSGPAAEEFADSHRLQPLLCGMGWLAERDGFALGAAVEPIALLPKFAYDLWTWGPVVGSLLDLSNACVDVEAGVWEPGLPAPRDRPTMLQAVLTSLHVLLAQQAGYLDTGFQAGY